MMRQHSGLRTAVSVHVRTLRLRQGWTQRQLAERARISPEAVWTIENGRKHPRAATARLLADALGVGQGELLGAQAGA